MFRAPIFFTTQGASLTFMLAPTVSLFASREEAANLWSYDFEASAPLRRAASFMCLLRSRAFRVSYPEFRVVLLYVA